MVEREIDAGDEGRYLVQVAANADVIQAQERSFEWALAATFLTLALALIGSTALAVRYGLRPLRALRDGVAAIRRGEAEHIAGEFPQDVAPLAAEVNQLIDANRRDRRARAHAGRQSRPCAEDSAERADQRGGFSAARTCRERFANRPKSCASRSASISTARAPRPAPARSASSPMSSRSWRAWCAHSRSCTPSASLNFTVELQDGLKFRGESQDLTDLIGNLLDNAGKWARETVSIRASRVPAAERRTQAPSCRRDRRRRSGPRARRASRSDRAREAARRIAAGLRPRPFDRRRSRGELRRLVAARRKSARAACARSCGCPASERLRRLQASPSNGDRNARRQSG